MRIPNDYFAFEKNLYRTCGVSLNRQESKLYRMYSFIFLIFFPYFYICIAITEAFKKHTFEELCLLLVYTVCAALNSMKIITMLLHRKKMGKILDDLHRYPFTPSYERGGEFEEDLVRNCLKFNSRLRTFYIGVVMVSVTGTIGNALLKRMESNDYHDWEMGFGSITAINVTYSPNFEIIMIYQDMVLTIGGFQFIAFDLIFVGIVSHLCVQFKILQNSLRKTVENAYRKMQKEVATLKTINTSTAMALDGSTVTIKYLHETIRDVVVHHLAIIELSKQVEEIYSNLLLAIYLTSMVMICFGLYLCTVVAITDTKMLIFITGILTIWCQAFCICYWCDDVTKQSVAVGQAAYEANFVGTNLKFQKSLALIINRSLNPTVITAGKFFNITLDTFMKIQQAAYSFFMVIRRRNAFQN